jgi:hypothetical protein
MCALHLILYSLLLLLFFVSLIIFGLAEPPCELISASISHPHHPKSTLGNPLPTFTKSTIGPAAVNAFENISGEEEKRRSGTQNKDTLYMRVCTYV